MKRVATEPFPSCSQTSVLRSTRFLGGLFSLDGVHPSNIAHGLIAYFSIDALNQRYGAGIPQIDGFTLFYLTATDPFIDKDRDGRVSGHFGAGLLETLLAVLNISGDPNDGNLPFPTGAQAAPEAGTGPTPAVATTAKVRARVLDEYERQTGRDLRRMSAPEQRAALHALFGTSRFVK